MSNDDDSKTKRTRRRSGSRKRASKPEAPKPSVDEVAPEETPETASEEAAPPVPTCPVLGVELDATVRHRGVWVSARAAGAIRDLLLSKHSIEDLHHAASYLRAREGEG